MQLAEGFMQRGMAGNGGKAHWLMQCLAALRDILLERQPALLLHKIVPLELNDGFLRVAVGSRWILCCALSSKKNPCHHAVVVPKPVTPEVAALFNIV